VKELYPPSVTMLIVDLVEPFIWTVYLLHQDCTNLLTCCTVSCCAYKEATDNVKHHLKNINIIVIAHRSNKKENMRQTATNVELCYSGSSAKKS
jgi:hypothetical protein